MALPVDWDTLNQFFVGTQGYGDSLRLVLMRAVPRQLALGTRQADVRIGGSGREKRGRAIVRTPRSFARCLELQQLPPDFLADAPFTISGKRAAIGNGVPRAMGRAVARAVKRALS